MFLEILTVPASFWRYILASFWRYLLARFWIHLLASFWRGEGESVVEVVDFQKANKLSAG